MDAAEVGFNDVVGGTQQLYQVVVEYNKLALEVIKQELKRCTILD